MRSYFVGFLKKLIQIVCLINCLLELASQAETLRKGYMVEGEILNMFM